MPPPCPRGFRLQEAFAAARQLRYHLRSLGDARTPLIVNRLLSTSGCFAPVLSKSQKYAVWRTIAERSAGCTIDAVAVPRTYVLPSACGAFASSVDRGTTRAWLLKPARSQHGQGIRHLSSAQARTFAARCEEETRAQPLVAQENIEPLPIEGGFKFDLRAYMLVIGRAGRPPIAYFHEGFARRANTAYDSSASANSVHVTNAQSQTGGTDGRGAWLPDHFLTWERVGLALAAEHGLDSEHMQRAVVGQMLALMRFALVEVRATLDRDCLRNASAQSGRRAASSSPSSPSSSSLSSLPSSSEGLRELARAFRADSDARTVPAVGSFQLLALDFAFDASGSVWLLEVNTAPGWDAYPTVRGLTPAVYETLLSLVMKVHASANSSRFYSGHAGWRWIGRDQHRPRGQAYNACAEVPRPRLGVRRSGRIASPASSGGGGGVRLIGAGAASLLSPVRAVLARLRASLTRS